MNGEDDPNSLYWEINRKPAVRGTTFDAGCLSCSKSPNRVRGMPPTSERFQEHPPPFLLIIKPYGGTIPMDFHKGGGWGGWKPTHVGRLTFPLLWIQLWRGKESTPLPAPSGSPFAHTHTHTLQLLLMLEMESWDNSNSKILSGNSILLELASNDLALATGIRSDRFGCAVSFGLALQFEILCLFSTVP